MKTTPAPLCAARASVPCNHSGDSMKFFDPGRFLIGGIFLAFGLFMLHQTVIFECSFTPEPFSLHPMDFPRAVLVLWCLLAVIYIVAPREPVVFIPLKHVVDVYKRQHLRRESIRANTRRHVL